MGRQHRWCDRRGLPRQHRVVPRFTYDGRTLRTVDVPGATATRRGTSRIIGLITRTPFAFARRLPVHFDADHRAARTMAVTSRVIRPVMATSLMRRLNPSANTASISDSNSRLLQRPRWRAATRPSLSRMRVVGIDRAARPASP